MRGTLDFDPAAHSWGPATTAIRTMLLDWASVDWFAPATRPAARAMRLFEEHLARVRRVAPDLLPEGAIEVRVAPGGFAELAHLVSSVRATPPPPRTSGLTGFLERLRGGTPPASPATFDWKFGVLKKVLHRHTQRRGWSREAEARRILGDRDATQARSSDLYFLVGDTALWRTTPAVDIDVPSGDGREAAVWYHSGACVDFTECIEWQLAAGTPDTRWNPFLPLVRCYVAGYYPVFLGPRTVSLWTLVDS